MTIKKTIYSTELESDMKKIADAVEDYMLQATDPCAWATQQMFDKLKNPNPGIDEAGYDTVAWDNDVWVPKGTKYIP